MPETALAGVQCTAERLRAMIAAETIPIGSGQAVTLSVSMGVATFPIEALTEEQPIAAADRAMYAAKDAGRNRVR